LDVDVKTGAVKWGQPAFAEMGGKTTDDLAVDYEELKKAQMPKLER
jgi:hypothetical protein